MIKPPLCNLAEVLSHRKRVVANIVKEVLLGDAAVGDGKIGEAVRIVDVQYLLNPGVDGEGLSSVKAEQQGAFRHLGTDATDGLEDLSGLVDGHGGNSGQLDFPIGNFLRRIQYVFCPESRTEGREVVQGKSGDPFGTGKCGTICGVVTKCFAKSCDDAFDAGNIVVLADDKRAESLPGVLTENADASGVVAGQSEGGVVPENLLHGVVIGVQVEIGAPDGFKFFTGGVVEEDFRFVVGLACVLLADGEKMTVVAAAEGAVIACFPSEALAAVQGVGQ